MSATTISQGLASAAAEIENVKSAVEDGAENAMHVAKQTLRRARHAAEDASEEAVHQMKRHPLESAGVSFGVGLLAGLALGMALFRRKTRACGHAGAL
jgi:ElaB/YqjD/DUF883 family membrane-anchored ribosome-binding protein